MGISTATACRFRFDPPGAKSGTQLVGGDMKRFFWVVTMVGIAVGVGVLAVYAAVGVFPDGIRAKGIAITPLAGEGEGEGELAFKDMAGRITFYDGAGALIDFQTDNGSIQFLDESTETPQLGFLHASSVVSIEGGTYYFGDPGLDP